MGGKIGEALKKCESLSKMGDDFVSGCKAAVNTCAKNEKASGFSIYMTIDGKEKSFSNLKFDQCLGMPAVLSKTYKAKIDRVLPHGSPPKGLPKSPQGDEAAKEEAKYKLTATDCKDGATSFIAGGDDPRALAKGHIKLLDGEKICGLYIGGGDYGGMLDPFLKQRAKNQKVFQLSGSVDADQRMSFSNSLDIVHERPTAGVSPWQYCLLVNVKHGDINDPKYSMCSLYAPCTFSDLKVLTEEGTIEGKSGDRYECDFKLNIPYESNLQRIYVLGKVDRSQRDCENLEPEDVDRIALIDLKELKYRLNVSRCISGATSVYAFDENPQSLIERHADKFDGLGVCGITLSKLR